VLLLDYDLTPSEVIRLFEERWGFNSKFRWPKIGRLRVKEAQAWRTTRGCHIRLRLRNHVPDLLLILIQNLMGSDFRREALNFRRLVELDDFKNDWNLLFFEKWKPRPDGYDVISQERPDRGLTRRIEHIIKRNPRRRRKK
jgi:hypothetical protein